LNFLYQANNTLQSKFLVRASNQVESESQLNVYPDASKHTIRAVSNETQTHPSLSKDNSRRIRSA